MAKDSCRTHTARNQNRRGRRVPGVIVFSGVDCSGKSTQIAELMEHLRQLGRRPCCLWLRVGYTPLFCALKNALRWLLGRGKIPQGHSLQRDRFLASGWKRMLWLHAAMADMAFETAVRIRALRFLGYTVICDRYVEESDMDLVLNFGERTAHMWAWRLVKAVAAKPDIRLLFDLPFGEALRRSILKKEPFPDPEEKRLLRAGLYENLKRESSYCVIDAQMSITEISALIDRLVAGEESLVHASTGVRP